MALQAPGQEKRKEVKNKIFLGVPLPHRQHRRHHCWWKKRQMEALRAGDVHDTLRGAGRPALSQSLSNSPHQPQK